MNTNFALQEQGSMQNLSRIAVASILLAAVSIALPASMDAMADDTPTPTATSSTPTPTPRPAARQSQTTPSDSTGSPSSGGWVSPWNGGSYGSYYPGYSYFLYSSSPYAYYRNYAWP